MAEGRATAASQSTEQTDLIFVPGARGDYAYANMTPYGRWAVYNAFAGYWIQYPKGPGAERMDYGAALVKPRSCPTKNDRVLSIQACIGAATMSFVGKKKFGTGKMAISVNHYPVGDPVNYPTFFDGHFKMWRCLGGVSGKRWPVSPVRPAERNYGEGLRGIGCESAPGSSGGGWFRTWSSTGGQLVSVVTSVGSRTWAPFLGFRGRGVWIRGRCAPVPNKPTPPCK